MEEILEFLKAERLSFEKAIALYSKHNRSAIAKKQAMRFATKTSIMAALVIYELEKIAGQPESGRMAEDFEEEIERPKAKAEKPDFEAEQIEEEDEAIVFEDDFQKRIEDMTESERALVVRKKQLNNRLKENRAALLETGESNADPNVLAERAGYIEEMKGQSTQIKDIHAKLNPMPEAEIAPEEIKQEIAKIEKKQKKAKK